MKKTYLLISFLLCCFLGNTQSLPEGGQKILGKDALKLFKPASNRGKMEWRKVAIKDNPYVKSALHLSTVIPPKEMWELQMYAPLKYKVEEGDNMVFSFYARVISTQDESTPGVLACVFEKASPDWNKSLHHFTELTKEWKQYFFPFKSAATYNPGEAQVSFQIGTTQQVIEIANVDIVNYKRKYDLDALPSSLKVDASKKNSIEAVTEVASKVIGPYPMNSMKTHIMSGLAEIKKIKVNDQTFTEAYQINVRVQPKLKEDVQLLAGNTLKVEQGDVINVSFKARATPNGKTKVKNRLYVVFEPNKPPIDRSLYELLDLDTTWKEFTYPFLSKYTYESGFAIFTFYAGAMVQSVEIADISILNYRKNIEIDKLPKTATFTEQMLDEGSTKFPVGANPVNKFMMSVFNATASGKLVPATGKDFKQCYQVTTASTTGNSKDVQCFVNTDVPLKKGDVMMLSFYARGPKSTEVKPASMTCTFGKATPNYDKSLSKKASFGPAWKYFSMPFVLTQDFEAGAAKLSFQIGSTLAQTVEIGKVSLINYQKTKKITELPVK